MSCTLLELCRLQELETVRDYLFQSQKIERQEETQQTGTNSCPFGFIWAQTGQIIKLRQVLINYLHHPLFQLNIWRDKGHRSYRPTGCDVCSLKVYPNKKSITGKPVYMPILIIATLFVAWADWRLWVASMNDFPDVFWWQTAKSDVGFIFWASCAPRHCQLRPELEVAFSDWSRCLPLAQRSKGGEGREKAVDRLNKRVASFGGEPSSCLSWLKEALCRQTLRLSRLPECAVSPVPEAGSVPQWITHVPAGGVCRPSINTR